MRLQKLLFPVLLFVISPTTWGNISAFEAKVVKVIDGDTITAVDAQKTSIKIRLYGIDAPESKQVFGKNARQALSNAVATKVITVVDHGTDVYGRMLGTVWLDGYDINASMVDSGYAWVYRFEGNAIVPSYVRYEATAQQSGKGLWALPDPVPPWEWRFINPKAGKGKQKK